MCQPVSAIVLYRYQCRGRDSVLPLAGASEGAFHRGRGLRARGGGGSVWPLHRPLLSRVLAMQYLLFAPQPKALFAKIVEMLFNKTVLSRINKRPLHGEVECCVLF